MKLIVETCTANLQTAFLQLIRDHIMTSLFERDDLDFAPFDAQGGLGKMH